MPKIVVADLIKFEVSLEEIVGAADLILRKTKDREVRAAIKTMFTELKKADKSFVGAILVPLFEIETQSDFDKQFGRLLHRIPPTPCRARLEACISDAAVERAGPHTSHCVRSFLGGLTRVEMIGQNHLTWRRSRRAVHSASSNGQRRISRRSRTSGRTLGRVIQRKEITHAHFRTETEGA